MRISILGVPYTLEYRKKAKDPNLEHCDGYCDFSTKSIVVKDYTAAERREPVRSTQRRRRRGPSPKNLIPLSSVKIILVTGFMVSSSALYFQKYNAIVPNPLPKINQDWYTIYGKIRKPTGRSFC